MKRLVIVEGPDCSGKTTLAKKIAVKLGMTYLHFSGHPSLHAGMTEYHASILRAVDWNIRHNDMAFVLDRCWQSELVYVPVMRPHMDGVYDYATIRKIIDPHRPATVLCMDDEIYDRYRAQVNDTHPYTPEIHAKIVDGYKLLMENTAGDDHVLHYDLTQPLRDDEIIKILDSM